MQVFTFQTPGMPKQALSQLPVGKAIVRVLVNFLQEIECTEFDETLHKLAKYTHKGLLLFRLYQRFQMYS